MRAQLEKRISDDDPHRELQREAVLAARAERRLLELEFTRRQTFLRLTVVAYALRVLLAVAGAAAVLIGEPYAGGALMAAAVGAAVRSPPRDDRASKPSRSGAEGGTRLTSLSE